MAFIRKQGARFQVRQGNNNMLLSSHMSLAEAAERVRKLHAEHKPQQKNRGQRAASQHTGKR